MKTILTVTASFLLTIGMIAWLALSQQHPTVEKMKKAVTGYLAPAAVQMEDNRIMAMRMDVYRNEGAEYMGLAQQSLEEGWRLIKPYLPNADTIKAYEDRMGRLPTMDFDARGAEIEAILERWIFEIDFYADRTTGDTVRTSYWNKLKNGAPAQLFYDMEFNLMSIRHALGRINPANPEKLWNSMEWSLIKVDIERQRWLLEVCRKRP